MFDSGCSPTALSRTLSIVNPTEGAAPGARLADTEERRTLYQISAHEGFEQAQGYHLKMKAEEEALGQATEKLAQTQANEDSKMQNPLKDPLKPTPL